MKNFFSLTLCFLTLGLNLFAQPPCSNPQACNYTSNFVDLGFGLAIPENQTPCFLSQLTVTSFNDGTIINDANNDIINLFMNIEHSYMGDLIITLICPNGQSVKVHERTVNV